VSLAGADRVAVASVYHGEALSDEERLDVPRLIREVAALGVPATTAGDAKAIVDQLGPELRPDDVVLVMSNGGFDGIHERLLEAAASIKTLQR